MEAELRNGIILALIWTGLRIIFIGWLFLETTKLIEIIGGLIAFLIYCVIIDWVFKTTKPIDEALAENLKKIKEKIGDKAEKKFGKGGKEFWKGFNTPLP